MKEFQIETILVPTDFSDPANKAIEMAAGISKRIGCKLILMHVVETQAFMPPVEMMSAGIIDEKLIKASNTSLKKRVAEIQARHGIKAELKSFRGNVYDNIIRAAHIVSADLIIMGTHGTSGFREWFFGSNAYSVVNNTTVPVLTINQNSDLNSIKKIVFPFNDNLLTLKKVDVVIMLAKLFDAEIMLFGFSLNETASNMTFLRQKAKDLSDEFTKHDISSSFVMAMGSDYADEILTYASNEHADLITVITSRTHSVDTILKSKPERKLVNHSTMPVLSVPVE